MDVPHLEAKLRGRDHAMILLGIGGGLIILWLLLHRKGGSVTNETINNIGSMPDFSTGPWPDYSLVPVAGGGNEYVLNYRPATISPGDVSLSLPVNNVGIENCACGCDDFVAPTLLPGPVPTLVVSSPPAPQEVVVIVPPPPPPPKVHAGSAMGWI